MRGFFQWLFGTDPHYRRLIFWSIGLTVVIVILFALEWWG